MDSYIINMSSLAFAILNVPVSGATILTNMFFVYCLFYPQTGPDNSLKPPLNVLLGSLIGCNLTLNVFNLLFVSFDSLYPKQWMYTIASAVIMYATRTSFTTSLGLNIFYYFQIVPVRLPFLVWVKMHIKHFMYSTLFCDRIFFLFEFFLQVMHPWKDAISEVDLNSTCIQVNIIKGNIDVQYYLSMAHFWIRCGYFFLCLVIMLASSSATALYLWSHMKNMEGNSSPFSALHQQRQMRVTIMGIIKMVLFFLSSMWLMTEDLMIFYFGICFDQKNHAGGCVVALYSLGITIILGVGQSTFRLRVIDIGKKLLETLKFLTD
ncbi:uncharacterized protein LOC127448528 [Myxocyprinus asiaticus]|uniref:uncharacterized protein LOC127448528 n=1 Tax=Myxocyprinus asiaticus TaxID=70543 RepID=UPI0022234EB1|nr:uncharacterized protein LOC127448528 [Myxocyprinus asiaticus]